MTPAILLALSFIGAQTEPGDLVVRLSSGAECAQCHSNSTTRELSNDTYAASMMRLASVDPIYLAALEIAYEDAPGETESCIRCHTFSGWSEGRGTPGDGSALQTSDLHGIACDTCHRQDPDPTLVFDADRESDVVRAEWLDYGNAELSIAGIARRGTFDNAAGNVKHSSLRDPLFEKSVVCAQCHTVSGPFPRVDIDTGAVVSSILPEQRTFKEWAQSSFAAPGGKSCQDCHMPVSSTGPVLVNGGSVEAREIHDHTFVGGNHIAQVMTAARGTASLPDEMNGVPFAAPIARQKNIEFLQTETAELSVVENAPSEGVVRVKVENKTGHKLPTGYSEGRRLWLEHDIRSADGSVIAHKGAVDSATHSFQPDQIPEALWEIVLGSPDGQPSFRFLKSDRILKDSRIPPKGFVPDGETAPVGRVFDTLPDGSLANYDTVELETVDGCYPQRIHIQLRFQTSSGEFLKFLIDNATENGPIVAQTLAAIGGAVPVTIAEQDLWLLADGSYIPYDGPRECSDTEIVEPDDMGPGTNDMDASTDDLGGGTFWSCSHSGPGSALETMVCFLVLFSRRIRRTFRKA